MHAQLPKPAWYRGPSRWHSTPAVTQNLTSMTSSVAAVGLSNRNGVMPFGFGAGRPGDTARSAISKSLNGRASPLSSQMMSQRSSPGKGLLTACSTTSLSSPVLSGCRDPSRRNVAVRHQKLVSISFAHTPLRRARMQSQKVRGKWHPCRGMVVRLTERGISLSVAKDAMR